MVWWIIAKSVKEGRNAQAAPSPQGRLGPFPSVAEAEAARQRLVRERRQAGQALRIVCDFS